MKMVAGILSISLSLLTAEAHAQTTTNPVRDEAIAGVEACLKSGWAPSQDCNPKIDNTVTLEELYRQGDKSVLPTLIQLTSPPMHAFQQSALIADSAGYLKATTNLPPDVQSRIVNAIADRNPTMGRAQFDALSNALSSIPESTPEFDLAQRCLQKLRLWHAELYYQFFPPGTFASWKGPAKIASYSRALASVDEKPIWQSISQSVSIYRVSIVGWRYVDVVKLTVLPDGTGEIVEKPRRHGIPSCPSPTHGIVSKDQVVAFTQKLDQASFWTMPAEDRARGADGSDSVLESVQNGKYHLVDRWSPMHTDFGDLVTALFDLAAKNPGDC